MRTMKCLSKSAKIDSMGEWTGVRPKRHGTIVGLDYEVLKSMPDEVDNISIRDQIRRTVPRIVNSV